MDIEQARFNMIEQQIRTWEVLDQSVLNLLGEIHREDFVPEAYRNLAFADIRIPLGHEQSMMFPKEEARLLQTLAVTEEENVLEVGTGSGYLTALLAKKAKQVTSIDTIGEFIDISTAKLNQYQLNNVTLEKTDIYVMLNETRKYDVVVVTGSIPIMDGRFLNLLNENGRMLMIIGESPVMEICLINKKNNNGWSSESLFETDIPALSGVLEQSRFQF